MFKFTFLRKIEFSLEKLVFVIIYDRIKNRNDLQGRLCPFSIYIEGQACVENKEVDESDEAL